MTPTFNIGDRIRCVCRYCRVDGGLNIEGTIVRIDRCYHILLVSGSETEVLFWNGELVSCAGEEVLFRG